ncbi:hypothetical protein [Lysobacter gummosus]|uniref:hypothetical protein n=1 Tax=Lysobacter gummosus TaxID=262324 RepID=UPI003636F2F4
MTHRRSCRYEHHHEAMARPHADAVMQGSNTGMSRFVLSRNFLLVWIGQMLSGIGSKLSSFALGLWVLRTTGSTTQFAITFIVTALPAILPRRGPARWSIAGTGARS